MVQRKVPNKLGIQADRVKPKKQLGNLRPSSPHQHQDGKNKGVDLKKRMKKSRSIKRSDLESLKSHTFGKEVPQPGKPPPVLDVPASSSTPQKESPVKKPDSSPNYMRSTSSFEARKERSQVSSKSPQSSIESRSPKKTPNNSRLSSVSAHKASKAITRTSSLKLVRTLTKSPSFKPTRASTKKCSPVVLCEDINTQRATCSSTLKDSKFPTYLELSHGATESEGTSAVKVCPYTYCSLNGHRHAPLPPLKCFLSARRRMLKTQKSMKLGCLSPRRAKPSGDVMKEIVEKITHDEKPEIQEIDSNEPVINPLVKEDQTDFFIEIYVQDTEDAAEETGGSKQNGDDQDEIGSVVGEDDGGQVVESCSNEEPYSEIDSEDDLQSSGEVRSTEMEAAEEETPICQSNQSGFEVETPGSTELDGTDSEASEMEWEEGQHSAPSLDEEFGNSAQTNNENDLESGSSFGDDPSFHGELIFKSDDIISSYFDESSADEGHEEFFGEGGESSNSECSYRKLGVDEPIEVFNTENNLVSPTYDVLEESNTEERDGNAELDDFSATVISSAPKTEEQETNQSLKQELPIADAGDGSKEEDQEDVAKSLIIIPSFELLQGLSEADRDTTNEDKLGAMAKDGESNQDFVDEGLLDKEYQTNNVAENQKQSQKYYHEDQSFKISDSLDSDDQTHSGLNKVSVAEISNEVVNEMEVVDSTVSDPEESLLSSENEASTRAKTAYTRGEKHPSEELPKDPINLKIIRCKRPVEELEEPREFNPRDPNFLPVEPYPDAEKVDLRHQMMDDRKNAEEWMLDYALQQAVTKLAPARKRKVALLVEAFEKVTPIPKYESHPRRASAPFAHSRPIQACS